LESAELLSDVKLVIPVTGSGINGRIVYSRYPSRYRAHTGDTVLTVAEDFGVPPERLRRWNRLKGNELRKGRLLTVYKPLAPGEPDKAPPHKRQQENCSRPRQVQDQHRNREHCKKDNCCQHTLT